MKYLKNLALFVALCMVLSTVPVIANAAAANNIGALTAAADDEDTAATAEPTDTPDVDVTPEPSDEPDATSTPDATEKPDTSTEPDATSTPEVSANPDATADPNATATPVPTATAGTRYNITVDPNSLSTIKTYVNSTAANSALKGARVRVKARAARGYNYTRVYYKYDTDSIYEISTTVSESVDNYIEMPASDIVICAEVAEMSDQQLYRSAQQQYNDVTANLNTYTSRYINNSSTYDAADIREMRTLINDAKNLLPQLKDEYTYFNGLIRDDLVTEYSRNDVTSIQSELDEITDQIDELIERMGGNNQDGTYEIQVNVSHGGRVVFQGAVEATVNATTANASDYFTNVAYGYALTLKFSSTTGYTLSNVRINNRNVSLSGSTLSISAANIENYVVDGVMLISANFVYGNSGYTGTTYSGSGSSGSTTYNNPYYGNVLGDGTSATAVPTDAQNGGTQSSAFTDLADVEWAIPSINALSSLGIINGMGDGRFEPQSHVTREQFAKMIVGVMGYSVDQSATTEFSDDMGDWYTPYIAAAAANGIITGRPDGTFGVGDDITRQDIAVIIYRTQDSPATEAHQFPDSGSISDYAVDAVSYLYNSGIAGGDDQGNFNPVNPATRAEAAKMLYGLYISLGR